MDRINWITTDAFNAVAQLRRVGGNADPQKVYEKMRGVVEDLVARAGQAGFSREDSSSIAYAVVALIDEVAMMGPAALHNVWQQMPLQMHFFRANVAGDRFFTVLEELRRDRTKVDLLRVYYVALALGFQGRYRAQGGEVAIADLLESVRNDLEANLELPEKISPHGLRPSESLRGIRREFPFVWIAAGIATLVVVAYAGFHATLNDGVRGVLGAVTAVAAK